MSPYTYTLIVKGIYSQDHAETLIAEKFKDQPQEFSYGANLARTMPASDESLILLHVREDHSRYGFRLAGWLGEMPYSAPYPRGSLLWYR